MARARFDVAVVISSICTWRAAMLRHISVPINSAQTTMMKLVSLKVSEWRWAKAGFSEYRCCKTQ
jgi:hypothetical protein